MTANLGWKKNVVIFALSPLICSVSFGFVPEGLDNFGLNGHGQGTTSISTAIDYRNVKWLSDYESFQLIAGIPVGSSQLTYGGRATVANTWGDRTSYFARYDLRFGDTSSLGLKWIHTDWKFISSSKDTLAFDFNSFFDWGPKSGFYVSIGGYYRWLRQRWNDPWWTPFSFSTQDQQGMMQACVGWQKSLGKESYLTFDINTRDSFEYYNLDNMAIDLSINIGGGPGFYWNLFGGTRTSASFVGTMMASEIYAGAGFTVY